MRKSGWLPVTVVAFVLAGPSPALAQDMPDDATRAHVAEWLDQCSRSASDACMPVIKRIEDSPMFGWCQAIEWQWDAARLVRDPENAHFVDEAVGRRKKAREFIAECVPIYAAALRETDERDDSSGDTAYRGPVEPADRVMQAVTRSNLRGGPGTTYGKVGLLDIGDQVRVTGVVGDWLRIAAPDGGEAYIYGPLLAEVTPDQGTTAVEREPEPTIALEPKCTAELPDGSECWQELAERPGCHIYVLEYVHGLDPFRTWSGECAGGLAEGEGRLEETFGEAYYIEWSATFAGGKATDKKLVKSTDLLEEAVVDGPSEQAGPPGEAPLLANTPPDLAQGIPDDARPSYNSGQACDAWEASYTVTWTEEGLQRGGINLTEVEAGFLTKAEAEDFVQSICSSRHSQYGPGAGVDYVLESCTVGEATCVQPRSHAQQPDPPGEAPGTDTPSVDVPSGSGPLHGSIAFSQDDDGAYAWGIAWSFDSSAGARAEALGQCREYGGTQCTEAGWFQEACGALAVGGGNGYGTGWGNTTAEAERDALRRCSAANDDCRIEVARCSQSDQAGGSGRIEREDTAGIQQPDPPSDSSCTEWGVKFRVTVTAEALRDGVANSLEMRRGGTPAEAEEAAQRTCSSYWATWGHVLESCVVVVGEPVCCETDQDCPYRVEVHD